MDKDRLISGLYDQDCIHSRKKLINSLNSPICTLQLNGGKAMHKHIGLIYNKYTFDKYEIKLEDVNRSKKQNWASAQRICHAKANIRLRLLCISADVHQERTLDTKMYWKVCTNYIDIF
jgi:hypothetical protein